jgi:nucleoside-diphosphate-sugar epimerase
MKDDSDCKWKKTVAETSEGIKVVEVDGNYVRDNVYVDWVLGGHHYVYDWIPEDEVWIENTSSPHDRKCNLFHELVERHLMKEHGWDYESAHSVAANKERDYRESLADRSDPS